MGKRLQKPYKAKAVHISSKKFLIDQNLEIDPLINLKFADNIAILQHGEGNRYILIKYKDKFMKNTTNSDRQNYRKSYNHFSISKYLKIQIAPNFANKNHCLMWKLNCSMK